MGVQDVTLKTGATSIDVTGGTDLSFAINGEDIANGIQLSNDDNPDFLSQVTLMLKNRQPRQTNGVFSKSKRVATLSQPRQLEDGTTVYDIYRTEVEIHPETSSADAAEFRMRGAQMGIDAELATFWSAGAMS